jgi:predicted HTH domain antitoxin
MPFYVSNNTDETVMIVYSETCVRHMSHRSITASVILYSSGELTLKQAAERSDVSLGEMRRELRSRGITVREESLTDEPTRETS